MTLTVAVLVLLGLLMTTSIFIWIAEILNREDERQPECGTAKGKTDMGSGPIRLGITSSSAKQEKKETIFEKLKTWIVNIREKVRSGNAVERWINFAISRSRMELGMDAEEGLLLSVQVTDVQL